MKILIVLFSILLIYNSEAQTIWKGFGTGTDSEAGKCLVEDSLTGNLIVGANKNDSTLLIFLDSNYSIQHTVSFKGSLGGDADILRDLRFDNNHFLIGCGNSLNNSYDGGAYAFKMNPVSGVFSWIVSFADTLALYRIMESPAGGDYAVLGSNYDHSGQGINGMIATIGRSSGVLTIISDYHLGNSEDFSDGFFVGNQLLAMGRFTHNDIGFSKMRPAMALLNYPVGDIVWSKSYLVTKDTTARMYSFDVEKNNQDSVMMLSWGNTNSVNTSTNSFFLSSHKISGGELGWAKKYTISGVNGSLPSSLLKVDDGWIVMGSSSGIGIYIMKTDQSGNILWSNRYTVNGNESAEFYPRNEMIFNKGKYFVTGSTTAFSNNPANKDILLFSVSEDGSSDCCQKSFPISINNEVINFTNNVILIQHDVNVLEEFPSTPVFNPNIPEYSDCSPIRETNPTFSVPDTICLNDSVQLMSLCPDCDYNYWEFSNDSGWFVFSNDVNPWFYFQNIPSGIYHFYHEAGPCDFNYFEKDIIIRSCCENFISGISSTSVACFGGSDGSAGILISGGIAPFSFVWSNAAGAILPSGNNGSVSNLSAGQYFVTVTDLNNCVSQDSVAILQPALLVVNEVHQGVSCPIGCGGSNCNGTISVTVSGGSSPYTYLWNDGSLNQNRSGLCAGTYSVTVTDSNGCHGTKTIIIASPPVIVITESHVNVSCHTTCGGTCNGSINISVTGGLAPYLFTWNNGSHSEDRYGLCAGTYTVSVKDANNCTAYKTIVISQPAALSLSVSSSNVSCINTQNGTATVIVSGGTPPYTYSWNSLPVQTGSSAYNLGAGTYTVTVTDSKGCVKSKPVCIGGPAPCVGFKTYTQGGWGAVPQGNNPGTYLNQKFAQAFPSGLTVGCNKTLKLTSAQAVTNFLPSGGTPSALTSNLTNPSNYNNTLAGQAVALKLNIGFDAYDPSFSSSTSLLGSLKIGSGTFAGWTVNQILAEVNKKLGGCVSPYSFSELNSVATLINENYDNCSQGNNLFCPCAPVYRLANAPELKSDSVNFPEEGMAFLFIENFPEPFSDLTNFRFSSSENTQAKLLVYDMNGKVIKIVFDKRLFAGEVNLAEYNTTGLSSGIYFFSFITDQAVLTRRMVLIREK